MKKELLKQYAQLVAGVGINVQKGQTVVVRCPVDCADFGRALCAACFELGAKDVVARRRLQPGALAACGRQRIRRDVSVGH